MGNVISLDERRRKKARERLESSLLKAKIQVFGIDKKIVSDLLLREHPISRRHREAGRVLYSYVDKEFVFEVIASARNSGFRDLCVETTAIYGTPEGVKVLEGRSAIYGKPLRG